MERRNQSPQSVRVGALGEVEFRPWAVLSRLELQRELESSVDDGGDRGRQTRWRNSWLSSRSSFATLSQCQSVNFTNKRADRKKKKKERKDEEEKSLEP